MRLDRLVEVLLQHGVVHAEPAARDQGFLIQEEAVGAIQVSGRAAGLGLQVESGRKCLYGELERQET